MNEQEATRVINQYLTQDELKYNIFIPNDIAEDCRAELLNYLEGSCTVEQWEDEVEGVYNFIDRMKLDEFVSFCCLYLHQEFKAITQYVCSPIHFIGVD